ncbi:MAG: metallophosphoesterase [Pirellulaceae bacterium]
MNKWWWIVAAVVVGHFGLHLTLYNRLNALGLTRCRIKQAEVFLLLSCLMIPPLAAWRFRDILSAAFAGSLNVREVPDLLWYYGSLCLLAWPLLGIAWLATRPIFGFQRISLKSECELVDVAKEVAAPLAMTPKCRWASRIPGNEIFRLAIEEKQLPVWGLPSELDGFRIAHLSDVHLTGHIATDFFAYIVQRTNAWQPDLIALTGDIIDKPECIAWLSDCFADANAPAGCFSILGNHDTQVADPSQIREMMQQIGWQDLGGRTMRHDLRGVPVTLIGNEQPWFPGPANVPDGEPADSLRIALCHSPDQIGWARRQGIELMLAGHTHGGQGRLPLAGPLLSPSLYGSRFASGEFYLAPTTMHVSRGLSGKHLLRLRCPPELSLLVLRCPPEK